MREGMPVPRDEVVVVEDSEMSLARLGERVKMLRLGGVMYDGLTVVVARDDAVLLRWCSSVGTIDCLRGLELVPERLEGDGPRMDGWKSK
jgi:hypothetical protein